MNANTHNDSLDDKPADPIPPKSQECPPRLYTGDESATDPQASRVRRLDTADKPASRPSKRRDRRSGGMFSRFGEDFGPLEGDTTPLRVVELLLKRPARVTHEIVEGNLPRIVTVLLTVIAVSMLGYGLVMGTFSGGHQLWAVPLKVVIGALLSALICLPSLYIFMCLSGSDQSFSAVWGLFLSSLALCGVLLVGFAPIAWIFSQSTNAIGFMGAMHLLFWLIGTCFGLSLLEAAFAFLNKRSIGVLKVWSVIFVLVVVQMCTALRPLVGEFQGFQLQGKKFFLIHWMTHSEEGTRARTL